MWTGIAAAEDQQEGHVGSRVRVSRSTLGSVTVRPVAACSRRTPTGMTTGRRWRSDGRCSPGSSSPGGGSRVGTGCLRGSEALTCRGASVVEPVLLGRTSQSRWTGETYACLHSVFQKPTPALGLSRHAPTAQLEVIAVSLSLTTWPLLSFSCLPYLFCLPVPPFFFLLFPILLQGGPLRVAPHPTPLNLHMSHLAL